MFELFLFFERKGKIKMALLRRCAMKFVGLVIAGIFAVSLAGVGLAKEPAQSKSQKEQQYKEFDFEKEEVTGEVLKPDQSVTGVVGRKGKSSLIQIRTDFRDEILKSVEDL
jgi:hypothetical protein